MTMKLSEMSAGSKVIIETICHPFLSTKLTEMGMLSGTELGLLYKAPLGDPIAIRVKGFTVCLRLDEAKYIHVDSL